MRPLTHLTMAVGAGLATFYMAAFSLRSMMTVGNNHPALDGVYAMIVLVLSGFTGWLVARTLRRRSPWTLPHVAKWARALLIVAYAATWIIGIPAAKTYDEHLAARWWNRSRVAGYETHATPTSSWVAGLAVAPGVIVSYQFLGAGPLDGWDGWTVHLWYGLGVRRVLDLTLGVS